MTPSLRDQVLGSPGYSTDLHLLPRELSLMRDIVEIQRMRREAAATTHEERYGRKADRLFGPEAVACVAEFQFLRHIGYEFGAWRMTPVIYEGKIDRSREEVYWRIVRPNEPGDVGGMHADSWYLDHFADDEGPLIAEGERTLKCWIPLECEAGSNGLAVVPDSHFTHWRTITEFAESLARPNISIPPAEQPPSKLLNTPPGNVVLFGDRLLHEGVVNRGTAPRISCEITLVIRGDS